MKKTVVFLCMLLIGAALFFWLKTKNSTDISSSSVTPTSDIPVASSTPTDRGADLTKNSDEPIMFSTDSLDVTVTKSTASPVKDGEYLLENATKCGPPYRPKSYYPDLVKTLNKLPKIVYTTTSHSSSTKSSSYSVSVIPNLLGHKDLDSVQADFFICKGDSGHLKAIQMNEKWLVFMEKCAENDTACQAIADVVTPTIQAR